VWGTPGGWQARPRWRTVGGVVPPPAPPRQRVGWVVGWTCTDESARGDTRYLTHMGYSIVSTPSPAKPFFRSDADTFYAQRGDGGEAPRSRWALTVCRLEWQGHGQGERQGDARVRVAIRICAGMHYILDQLPQPVRGPRSGRGHTLVFTVYIYRGGGEASSARERNKWSVLESA